LEEDHRAVRLLGVGRGEVGGVFGRLRGFVDNLDGWSEVGGFLL
jgi:hypothetical protein